jgi:hypothetical protein
MAEVLRDFGLVAQSGGETYRVRACGSLLDESRWQGWFEFEPVNGGETLRSGRETTQPNRTDIVYWASGLSLVYIEGALDRTLNPLVRQVPEPLPEPAYDEPAPSPREPSVMSTTSVLNPFSVYRKGEAVLRDQLHALSGWHLVNIIRDYHLSEVALEDLNEMSEDELTELIVANVRVAAEPGVVLPRTDGA